MRVSIIVAVYRDIEALRLIVGSLKCQTYKNFEVIIVEDGCFNEMGKYIASIEDLDIKHTTQEDLGVRKARSQNNGIVASSGEYLIFIDGDCPLYCTFIESHVKLAQRGSVLSGRRLNLNQDLTDKLRSGIVKSIDIEKHLLSKYLYLAFDKDTRFEQGIKLNPDGYIYRNFIASRERNTSILGCNFSCYRDNMIEINGFDESYGETSISDDMDLDWRFRAFGLKLKSCKNVANMFHLLHKAHDRGDPTTQLSLMRQREMEGKFICEVGLNGHDSYS